MMNVREKFERFLHFLKFITHFLEQFQFPIDGFSVIKGIVFYSACFIFPELDFLQVNEAKPPIIELFSPGKGLVPVVEGGAETGFGGLEAVQVLFFPGGIVKVGIAFIPLIAQEEMLFGELYVYMHHE